MLSCADHGAYQEHQRVKRHACLEYSKFSEMEVLHQVGEEIKKEVKCKTGYDKEKVTMDYMVQILVKLLEVKYSKICLSMNVWDTTQYNEVDFGKRIQPKCLDIADHQEDFMFTHKRMFRTLKDYRKNTLTKTNRLYL